MCLLGWVLKDERENSSVVLTTPRGRDDREPWNGVKRRRAAPASASRNTLGKHLQAGKEATEQGHCRFGMLGCASSTSTPATGWLSWEIHMVISVYPFFLYRFMVFYMVCQCWPMLEGDPCEQPGWLHCAQGVWQNVNVTPTVLFHSIEVVLLLNHIYISPHHQLHIERNL
jgi:hypothetical protein